MPDVLREFYESNIPAPLRYLAEKLVMDESYIDHLSAKGAQEELKKLQKKHGYQLKVTLDSDLKEFSKTQSCDALAKIAPANFKDFYKDYNHKDIVNNALTTSEPFKSAKSDYSAAITEINEMIKKVPNQYKAQDFIGLVKEVHDDLKTRLVEQQNLELDNIKNLGIPQADKDRITADLTESHKSELQQIDNISKTQQTQIHNSAMFEQRQRVALQQLCRGNEAMRRIIEELAEENRIAEMEARNDGRTRVSQGTNINPLSDVRLDQLTRIKSYAGTEIHIKDGKFSFAQGDGIISQIPLLGPLFDRFTRTDKVAVNSLTIAMVTKAQGYQEIQWDVDYEDQELAQSNARTTAISSIRAGFPPEKIHMRINGEKVEIKDLFKGHEHLLQSAKKEAEINDQITKKIEALPESNKTNVSKMKDDLKALRNSKAPVEEISIEPNTPGQNGM